jgi:hypothetical protein
VDRHWQIDRGRGWTGNGRPGEDVGGQVMADWERTWVDRHWQTRRGRG